MLNSSTMKFRALSYLTLSRKMALAGEDKEKQKAEGLAIARSLLDTACELFNGIYLITPFLRSDLTAELTSYIQQKDEQRQNIYLH